VGLCRQTFNDILRPLFGHVLGSGFLLPDGREFNKMEASETEQQATTKRITHRGSCGKQWLVAALVVLCVAVSWIGVIDDKTGKYVDGAFIQAVGAYAGARALNAGISVLQSGEMGGAFFIAEMSIHPFESLDPINDMVEDYATVMKYAIGSLVIQELLVEILSNSIFKWLITVAAVLLIASLLLFNGLYASPLLKMFFFVALVRFLFVITIFISGQVDNTFVHEKTVAEIEIFDKAAKEIVRFNDGSSKITSAESARINNQIAILEGRQDTLNTIIANQLKAVDVAEERLSSIKGVFKETEDLNMLESLKSYYQSMTQLFNNYLEARGQLKAQEKTLKILERELETVRESLANLYGGKGLIGQAQDIFTTLKELSYGHIMQAVNDAIASMLRLIALFAFKTLLMPLAFLLLILRAFKFIWGIDPRSLMSESYAEIKGDK
jgi:hypothetical protein